RSVDEFHLAGFREVDQDEHVGAEARHSRLDLALHGPGRDRGVDRVAAGLEDPHAGFGGEWMSGRDHTVLRDNGGPPARSLRGRMGQDRQKYGDRSRDAMLGHERLQRRHDTPGKTDDAMIRLSREPMTIYVSVRCAAALVLISGIAAAQTP